MSRHREIVEAERARDDALAQLAYEQAERRQWEAHYRAEHADYLAEVEAERDSLRFELDGARMVNRKNNEHLIAERDAARGKLDQVRDLAHQPIGFRVNRSIEPVIRARDVLAILDSDNPQAGD